MRKEDIQLLRQLCRHLLMNSKPRMDISVCGKIVVAVPEPGLDIFHCVAKVQHNSGAAVPQVMESDAPQSILCLILLDLFFYSAFCLGNFEVDRAGFVCTFLSMLDRRALSYYHSSVIGRTAAKMMQHGKVHSLAYILGRKVGKL